MLAATVSGSFRRHLTAIAAAVQELTDRGVRVLSPADPRIVDAEGEFVFVASDKVRSVRLVQDRHLQCVAASDFLWLVCPDGYVGRSASLELGFAIAQGTPILSTATPDDLTLRQYVRVVPNIAAAVDAAERCKVPQGRANGILIDPHDSIDHAHGVLEALKEQLMGAGTRDASEAYARTGELKKILTTPGDGRIGQRGIRHR